MTKPQRLYHLVVPDEWNGDSEYAPASLHSEGFIHLSMKEQLLGSASRFFSDAQHVLVVEVAPEKLHAELLYEEADGQHFPHLYGPLNSEAVVAVTSLRRNEAGQFLGPLISQQE